MVSPEWNVFISPTTLMTKAQEHCGREVKKKIVRVRYRAGYSEVLSSENGMVIAIMISQQL